MLIMFKYKMLESLAFMKNYRSFLLLLFVSEGGRVEGAQSSLCGLWVSAGPATRPHHQALWTAALGALYQVRDITIHT